MYKHIIKIIFILLLISLILPPKNKLEKANMDKTNKNSIPLVVDNKGYITITKINLKYKLLDINDPSNNIESNVTIKDIDEEKNYFLIMAHSGTGPKAFFKDLKYLKLGDNINITYNNLTYNYYVTSIERQEKTGTISIKKDQNTLVLTTCDTNNKQLIIYAKI